MQTELHQLLNHLPKPSSSEFFPKCEWHGITSLLYLNAQGTETWQKWPEEIRSQIETQARFETALELCQRYEIQSVLSALSNAGVVPLLIKGAHIAYTYYISPVTRSRCDTDLIIGRGEMQKVKEVLSPLGYSEPNRCSTEVLFGQFILEKTDSFGAFHVLDFHIEISTRKLFTRLLGELFSYENLKSSSVEIPALGKWALGLSPSHALLLACIHPVMHHHHEQRLIWLYDIHLLASRMGRDFIGETLKIARSHQVGRIVQEGLISAHRVFETSLPEECLNTDNLKYEASAFYLRKNRRWHHEVLSDLVALPSWKQRAQLIREIIFPKPTFLLRSYFATFDQLSWVGQIVFGLILPFLYVHRIVRGIFRAGTGRKR